MAAEIKKALDVDVELIRSDGGVFEVREENVLIFSKKALGRFPTTEEILEKLQ
ncbi:Rdx family protein [candidate division KSB1 bacterium]|nr:Rdx family protein [candidate division KSB1 bacterium]